MIEDISFGYDYDEESKVLIARPLIQDYGLFSTFCLLLSATTACHAKCGTVPDEINFGNSLSKFNNKENPIDLYKFLFKIDHSIEIPKEKEFHVGPDNHHTLYTEKTIKGLSPFFKRYFSLNEETLNVKKALEAKYNIEDKNRLSVIYRASDKWTDFGGFLNMGPGAYYRLAWDLWHKHQDSGIKLLIQTEDMGVADWFCRSLHGSFITETKIGETNSTTQPIPSENKDVWLRNFVASLYIHAESKILVTYSGNSGYFSALARGTSKDLYQEHSFTKNCKEFFFSDDT
jgi:hypothetical protein